MSAKKEWGGTLKESQLQTDIKDAINAAGIGQCWVASSGTFKSLDGRRYIQGMPEGFPDLFGYRRRDGKMFFIEVKRPKQTRSDEQIAFGDSLRGAVLYGVARSIDDAFEILGFGDLARG